MIRLLLAGVLLLLTACGVNTTDTTSESGPLRITVDPWPGYGALYIAEAQGFFEQAGLNIEITILESASQSAQAFAEKRSDVVFTVLPDALALSAAGVPIQVIWATDTSTGGDVLMAASGITTVADLRGKRVAMNYGTFSQIFVAAALAQADLSLSDVTIVNIPPEGVADALRANQIDAGHTYGPYTVAASQVNATPILTSADIPGVIVDVIGVQTELIEEDSDQVQGFVSAIRQAVEWWQANPEAGNQIVAAQMNIPPADMTDTMTGLQLYGLEDNFKMFDTTNPQSLYEQARFAVSIFSDQGVIQQLPDISTLLDSRFIQSLAGSQ